MEDGDVFAIQIAFALLVVKGEANTIKLEGRDFLGVFQFVDVQISISPLVGIVVED